LRSIRTELILWLGALGVLPALAATAVTILVVWHARGQEEERFLGRTVAAVARGLEHQSRLLERTAAAAALDPVLAPGGAAGRPEDPTGICAVLAPKYRADALALYDADGNRVSQHGSPPPQRGRPSGDWVRAEADGLWLVAAAPLRSEASGGAGGGWVVAYDHIGSDYCRHAHQTSGTLIGLYSDRDRALLSQSGGMAIDPSLAALLASEKPANAMLGDERLLVVGKTARVGGEGTGIRVVAATVPRQHWDGMVRAGWLIVAMLSGVLLLSSGAGAALARKIADPLVEIANAARSLAKGDLSRRVRVEGTDELHSLSESFNHMAGALEEQTQQLRSSNEELDRQMARVQELNSLLREAVRTDSLTQVRTHGYIQQQLAKHLEVAKQSRRPLSVLMIDVDHFKWINDTHGHPTGDQALKEVSRAISGAIRHNDLVGRQGGDEFCVVLPAAGAADAERCAHRIRTAIAGTTVRGTNRAPLRLTVSVGAATFPDDGEEATSLVAAADRALYEAKLWRDQARHLIRPGATELETSPDDSLLLDGPTVQAAIAMAASVGSSLSSTVHHPYAVAARASAIGTALNLGRDGRAALRIACLLHDIGKVALPPELLRDGGARTPEDQKLMESHAELGYRVLRHLGLPQPIPEIVRCHHERYDGRGFPRGLRGEQTPLAARILAVAGMFVGLTLPAEREEPLDSDEALAKLQEEAGKALDPVVVAALAETLQWKGPRPGGKDPNRPPRQAVRSET